MRRWDMWLTRLALGVRMSLRPMAGLLLALVAACAATVALGRTRAVAGPPALVELEGRRTATSKTFRRPDGSITKTLYSAPVHYRDGGAWRPIDPTLVRTSGLGASAAPDPFGDFAYRTRANARQASFKERAGAGFLRLGIGGRALDLGLEGARPASAAVQGAEIAYADVLPATDLAYRTTATGVEETLVLRDASAPSTFRFRVASAGGGRVTVRRRPGGSWLLRTGGGGQGLVLAAPFATDDPALTGGGGTRHRRDRDPHAAMTVARDGDAYVVTVSVDDTWLRAPGRRFPVTVDPTLTIQPSLQEAEFEGPAAPARATTTGTCGSAPTTTAPTAARSSSTWPRSRPAPRSRPPAWASTSTPTPACTRPPTAARRRTRSTCIR